MRGRSGFGSIWVSVYGDDTELRIDPSTNTGTSIKVGRAPYDVTFAAGAAWVTNFGDDESIRRR